MAVRRSREREPSDEHAGRRASRRRSASCSSRLDLTPPGDEDVVVDVEWSGISTGTERLLWSGRMPPFPGMGYPLVPGYEIGRPRRRGRQRLRRAGSASGSSCPARAASATCAACSAAPPRGSSSPATRSWRSTSASASRACCWRWPPPPTTPIAAGATPPDLIVGHGVLGRLLARLAVAARRRRRSSGSATRSGADGAEGYRVVDPAEDARRDYRAICDVSGDPALLDTLIARLAPGGEIVLAGFYSEPLTFAFPPAFMREARIRVAAEWTRRRPRRPCASSIADGRLSLDGLITHRRRRREADAAYRTAFGDPGLPEDGPRLESLRMNAPSASATLADARLSAHRPAARRSGDRARSRLDRAAEERDADHRDLRQGRHRQELHARQPQLHDGAAGQARAADRLRPEERHDLAAVRRPQLPDHHRDLARKKKLAGEEVEIGDVCFKRDGVFAMELGGPEVGRGCGGRGIIHGFELLEKLGFHEWGFDYVLLDFLGDVVCGGFGLPIARDMCQKVIVVGSNDLQSLYVANNVCSAVDYFRKLGGNVGVAGMVINKDDGTGEAAGLRRGRRHPGAGRDPGRRGHPPQERQLRDHRHARRPLGAAVRGAGDAGGRARRRCARSR